MTSCVRVGSVMVPALTLMCGGRVDRGATAAYAQRAGVRPMVVLREAGDAATVVALMRKMPGESYVYSHPQYTPSTLTAAAAGAARAEGALVAGAKVSKVTLDEVRSLRAAAGPEFALYDGRCRHMRASVEAGASGVVAVPLATLPADLPPRGDGDALQATIDRTQIEVDSEPDVTRQAAALTKILVESL